jgi:hypothetical protein
MFDIGVKSIDDIEAEWTLDCQTQPMLFVRVADRGPTTYGMLGVESKLVGPVTPGGAPLVQMAIQRAWLPGAADPGAVRAVEAYRLRHTRSDDGRVMLTIEAADVDVSGLVQFLNTSRAGKGETQ